MFAGFGLASVGRGIYRLTGAEHDPSSVAISYLLWAGYFFLMSLYWARVNVVARSDGLKVWNTLGPGRHYPWPDISGFGVIGRYFPTAVAVLKTGKVVKLASLNDGLTVREREPSWELRSALAELDKMRLSTAQHAT